MRQTDLRIAHHREISRLNQEPLALAETTHSSPHSLTEPSLLPLATSEKFGKKHAALIGDECPSKVAAHRSSEISQIRKEQSSAPVSQNLSSPAELRARTADLCPLRVATFTPDPTIYTMTSPVSIPATTLSSEAVGSNEVILIPRSRNALKVRPSTTDHR